MEDIEILENLISRADNIECDLRQSEVQAISNLIARNKELEKEYERVRAGRNWLVERISAQIATPELFDKLVEDNYIPK